jgi:hypothetical protein
MTTNDKGIRRGRPQLAANFHWLAVRADVVVEGGEAPARDPA